jgi:membrane-associated protease RseP (regulator of RpoE activity)
MTGPKHLWAGDWESEAVASTGDLAALRQPSSQQHADEKPAAPEPARVPRSSPRRRLTKLPSVAPATRRVAAGLVALAAAGAALALTVGSQSDGTHRAVRPWLGVELGAASLLGGFQSGFGSFPFAAGAIVTIVAPGSPAANAGIEPGDVISGIGSHRVSRPADVGASLAGLHAGERVPVQYEQGPLTFTALVTLTAQPAGHR